jgi:hypothetical protein
MVNVIPQKSQKAVHRDMRARFILATALVLFFCAAVSFLMLLPSYFVLVSNVGSTSSAAANLTSQSASDTAALVNAKSLLSVLQPLVAATTSPSEAIVSALAVRPLGVSVDQITYVSGASSTLMLVGSAANSDEVSMYKLALAADPLFTSVAIPVGALVGTDGGRFSITLSGKF